MTLRRKGTRRIDVAGDTCRRTVAPDDEPRIGIVVEHAGVPGRRLVSWVEMESVKARAPGSALAPRAKARCGRRWLGAIAAGAVVAVAGLAVVRLGAGARAGTGTGTGAAASGPPRGRSWSFDGEAAGAAPVGLVFARTGGGKMGRWIVRADPSAPSAPNVLAQEDADPTSFRFPVAVAAGVSYRDVRLSVKCKMLSGKVDQACGLAVRWRDAANYYVTRANALEGNIRLYYVKSGKRKEIASWSGRVIAGEWHEYTVEARGPRFEVFWDGARVLAHDDATLPEAGLVGVWTKADSVTLFDDLWAEPL